MKLKLGKFEADIPMVGIIVGAIIADNVYANYCKKKSYEKLVEEVIKNSQQEES